MFQEKTVLRMNHQHDLGMMNHMQLPSSSTTLDKGFITPNQYAPPKISISSSSGLDSVSSTACSSFAITPSLLDAIMMEEAGAVMSPPLMKAFHSSEGTYFQQLNAKESNEKEEPSTKPSNPLSCSPEFSLPSDILLSLESSPEIDHTNQEKQKTPPQAGSPSSGSLENLTIPSELLLSCSPPLFVGACSKPQVSVQLSPKRKKKKLSNNNTHSLPSDHAQLAFGDELHHLLVSQEMDGRKLGFHKFQTVDSPPRAVQEFDIHSNTRVFVLDLNLNEASSSNEEPQILDILACEMIKNGSTFKETGLYFQARIIQKEEDTSLSTIPYEGHFISDALFNLSRFIFSNCFSTDVTRNVPTKIVTLHETPSSRKLSLLQTVIDIVTKSPGLDHTNGLLNRLLELVRSHTISLMHVFSTNIRHDASPTEALQYFGHVSLIAPSLLCSCHTSNVNIDASRSCAHQTCRHASLLLQLMYPYLNKKREEYQKALNDSIEIDFELETSLLASDPSNTPPVEKERKRKTPEKASQKKKYSKIKVSPRVNVVVPSNGKKKPTLNLKTVKSNSPKKRLTSETSEGPLQCDNKENKVSEHTSSAASSKRPVFVVPPSKKHAQQNMPVSAERGASRNAPFNNTNNGIKASIPTTIVQAVTHVPPLHSGTVNQIAANPLRLQGTSTSTAFQEKVMAPTSTKQGPLCQDTNPILTESMVESILSPKGVPILHYFSTCKPKALESFWKSPRNTMIIKLRPFLSLRDLIQKFHEHPCLGLNNLIQFCKKIFNMQ